MAPGVCVTSFRMLMRCSTDLGHLRSHGLRLMPAATLTMNSWNIRERNYCTEKECDETPDTGKSNKKASASHSKAKQIQITSTSTHLPDNQPSSLAAQDIDISKLKVSELKTHLRERGLSTTGKKDILLARLRNYLQQQQEQKLQHHHQHQQQKQHEQYYNDDDTKMQLTTSKTASTTTETNPNTVFCKDNTEDLSSDSKEEALNQSENFMATRNAQSSLGLQLSSTADDAKKQALGEVTVEYIQGLPHLTVPLPSRNEKCRFALKPVSHKVGDLLEMLRAEDRGIDRATVLNNAGVRIASTCNIESLMDEPFWLSINDQKYKVVPPPRQRLAPGDINKLGDIKSLVAQLYEALHVGEYHIEKENELKCKLENLKYLVTPLEQQKTELSTLAARRTNIITWVGLGMMSVQFGILARLTWWEYSWDIMEPVTYFVTYGTAMACYAYFCITKQDYQLADVKDRQYLLSIHKSAKKQRFDIDKYNILKREIAEIEYDLRRLHDPLNLQLPPKIVRAQEYKPSSGNDSDDSDGTSVTSGSTSITSGKTTDSLTTKVTSKNEKPTGFRLPFFDTKN